LSQAVWTPDEGKADANGWNREFSHVIVIDEEWNEMLWCL